MYTILSLLVFSLSGAYSANELGDAAFSVSPNTYLTKQRAYEQATAAINAATPELPADLLMGLVWVESQHFPTAVSRLENGKRKTGVPFWKTPPAGTHIGYCGVTQVEAHGSWELCVKLRDYDLAFKTVVQELNRWRSACYAKYPKKNNLDCALTGYNGGFGAIEIGTKYASTVWWRTNLIRRAMPKPKS